MKSIDKMSCEELKRRLEDITEHLKKLPPGEVAETLKEGVPPKLIPYGELKEVYELQKEEEVIRKRIRELKCK